MTIKSGNCASCGFPILVSSNNEVSCPSCSTINAPVSGRISGFSSSLVWFGLGILAVLGYQSAKRSGVWDMGKAKATSYIKSKLG